MSWRMRWSYLKPPLPKSPIRLRSRQVILSNSSSTTTLQTPPGGGASNLEHLAADSAPVFERGSLGVEPTTTKKKTKVETTAAPRYSLRSMTKENKKPPPLPANVAVTSAMKKSVTTMRGRRI
ncbi:Uncharacterized protein Rs2_32567 [Raphanus sativus]|nr:Uncharacterized protein Rs2_32567 [Raphanus sativus]